MKNKQAISTCLWFENQAEEAVNYYLTIFENGNIGKVSRYGKAGFEYHGQPEGTVMTMEFELEGYKFLALNGGNQIPFNASISFFITCETTNETAELYHKLLVDGEVLMPLDKYEWSENYGWLKDKYGVSWQIFTGKLADSKQKLIPSLLFPQQQPGKAEDAIHYYTTVFKESDITGIMKYSEEDPTNENNVMHAQFSLLGQQIMAMDSGVPQDFNFNHAISFVVYCDNQDEIDYYWSNLSKFGQESQCGWLTDRFGISWQIVPDQLGELMTSGDKHQKERVTAALMGMKKIVIAELERAFEEAGVTEKR